MTTLRFVANNDRQYLCDQLTWFANAEDKYALVDHCYAKNASCSWSLNHSAVTNCLDSKIIALVRDDKVWLVKKSYLPQFKRDHPVNYTRTVEKVVEAIVSTPTVKEVVTETAPAKTNAQIYKNIVKLWEVATDMEGSTLKDFNKSIYFDLIVDVLQRMFKNATVIEKQNFVDYVSIACKDEDLGYVIEFALK